MSHLRFLPDQVGLLAGSMVLTAPLGLLVALRRPSLRLTLGLLSTAIQAVLVAIIAVAADTDLLATA